MKSKKPLTLLEIFICLALLTLLSGVLGWQMKDVLAHTQIRDGVDRLGSRIQEVRVLALSYQCDIAMNLSQEKKGFEYKISSEVPLPRFATQETYLLKGIESLTIDGKKITKGKITVFSNGHVSPSSSIGFHAKDRSLWIDLSAFPQIKVVEKDPGLQN